MAGILILDSTANVFLATRLADDNNGQWRREGGYIRIEAPERLVISRVAVEDALDHQVDDDVWRTIADNPIGQVTRADLYEIVVEDGPGSSVEPLTEEEAEFLTRFRALTPEDQQFTERLLDAYVKEQRGEATEEDLAVIRQADERVRAWLEGQTVLWHDARWRVARCYRLSEQVELAEDVEDPWMLDLEPLEPGQDSYQGVPWAGVEVEP